jgi:hypothetical protein
MMDGWVGKGLVKAPLHPTTNPITHTHDDQPHNHHPQTKTTGEKIPFSIQALWYDQKTRKAEHKDPKAYSVISALNVQVGFDLGCCAYVCVYVYVVGVVCLHTHT